MKKIFFIFLIIAGAVSVRSQEKVRFGLKGGLNISNLNSNYPAAELSSIHSFYAGGIASFPISKSFAVQSEAIWSGEGTITSDVKIELQYVRLPLLFQYRHASGFHVEAGPQIGVMIQAKATNTITKEEFEADKQLGDVVTSIAIGFGYRMKNGIGIDFRYAKGLDNPIAGQTAKLVVASGGLSYIF